MPDFNLSASPSDSLVGADDVADSFFLDAAGRLVGTDTVTGGGGELIVDRLVLNASVSLVAGAFANVSGIERLVFNAGGGSSVTLADAMVASASGGRFIVTGGNGNDTLLGSGVLGMALQISAGAGNDRIVAGGGADRLGGGRGNDTLSGGAGNDTLIGGDGIDRLEAGAGSDRLDGGAGNDRLVFAAGTFDLTDLVADESGGIDTLQFLGATPVVLQAALSTRISGIEHLLFGGGADVFMPGASFADGIEGGVMTVSGAGGNDNLSASLVNPLVPLGFLLQGGEGADTLTGGIGDDTLDAGIGIGPMSGGDGDDVLVVRSVDLDGVASLDGGADLDTLRITGVEAITAAQLANVVGIESIELDPGGGDITVPDTLAAATSIVGFDLNIIGSDEDDRIDLGGFAAGRDSIVMLGSGDDVVVGGAGDETVNGGSGADVLVLGTGTDRALFGAGQLNALDTVVADQGVAGDTLVVELAAGSTLPARAFEGVSGFDSFQFTSLSGGAVRLPTNLVSQSGLASVSVSVSSSFGVVIDGRNATGTWTLSGGNGNDTLFGSSGANTLSGGNGEDIVVGGDGGDQISLGGTDDRDLALITSIYDGTIDINGTLSESSLAGADRVTGLSQAQNYIAVDWRALGLAGSSTLFLSAGGDIQFGWGANVLNTANEIAGNDFGSLTAVRNAVGARITDGEVGVDESIILVIGGADETEFGVYYFQDRDDNATVDVADYLTLLAIGNTDVPTFNIGKGFTLDTLDLFA